MGGIIVHFSEISRGRRKRREEENSLQGSNASCTLHPFRQAIDALKMKSKDKQKQRMVATDTDGDQ
jgi:hypothetical protein